MTTIDKLIPHGRGLAPVLLKRAATVELDWATRRQRQFDATDSQGRRFAVALPDGSVLRGGDVLVAADGALLRVVAAPQPVLVVRHCVHHGHPSDLSRAAYQLGQRHAPIDVQADHLMIEPDAALAQLLRGMHLIVDETRAPFDPEGDPAAGGAHAHHEHAHHDHHHSHDHGHGH